MKSIEYTIKDPFGLHARPAGLLVKEAKAFQSKITIHTGEKSADATRLLAVLGLSAVCGMTIVVKAEGSDEELAIERLNQFVLNNL